MLSDLHAAMRLRRFWMLDAWLGITIRHRMSALGFVWHLLPTLIFVATVGTIFKNVNAVDNSFFLYLLAGLVIWTPINHVLTAAPDCYQSNKPFLLSGGLNLLMFNLKLLFEAFLYMIIQAILIVGALIVLWRLPGIDILYSIAGVFALFMLLFPVSVILALIGARFQDFAEAFRAIVRILFLATPIIWTVTDESRLAHIAKVLWINPFFFALEIIRAPLLGLSTNAEYWLPFMLHVVVTWVVAYILYGRLKGTTTLWL